MKKKRPSGRFFLQQRRNSYVTQSRHAHQKALAELKKGHQLLKASGAFHHSVTTVCPHSTAFAQDRHALHCSAEPFLYLQIVRASWRGGHTPPSITRKSIMQWTLPVAGATLLCALSPFSQARGATVPELFKPMPLAAFDSLQDETLRAIHNVPAFQMINRVAANTSALQEGTMDVTLSLASGIRGSARKAHAETLPDGSVVWSGQWNDTAFGGMAFDVSDEWSDAANEITLVNRQGWITGSIHANGQFYAVRPLASGGHAIIAVSEADMPAELTPMEADSTVLPLADPIGQPDIVADEINARVMIVFSDNAIRALADPVGLAYLAVAETNAGYARSGVRHRVEMAGNVYASEYRESGSL